MLRQIMWGMKQLLIAALCALMVLSCAGGPSVEEHSVDESGTSTVGGGTTAAEPAPDGEERSESPAERRDTEEAAPVAPSSGGSGARGAEAGDADEPFAFMEEPEEDAPAAALPSTAGGSGLRAGFADDNRQFNYFIEFLDDYGMVSHFPIDVQERIVLRVVDPAGQSVANAPVELLGQDNDRHTLITHADGTVRIFPAALGLGGDSFTARVRDDHGIGSLVVDRDGPRAVELQVDRGRVIPNPVELDIVFVLDTTGSMGEEIQRLRRTIELIYLNLAGVDERVVVRFGMVLYKDRGDEYVTKTVPLTDNLPAFQAALEEVTADGGGDVPEELQAALYETVHKLEWTQDGVRLAFIITDAPPQLHDEPDLRYPDTAREAAERGVKIHSVGTGGLALQAEYILRQISQYTGGRYIFLTYGESGESEGGRPGSVSHHTGANYQTDRLETIIIRFAREELAELLDISVEPPDEYFQAIEVDFEEREVTLRRLFSEAIGQLLDFSSMRIPEDAKVGVLPIVPNNEANDALVRNAEYFTAQLLLAAAQSNRFELVERADLKQLLKEIELQLSGLVNRETQVRVGELLGAEFLVIGQGYHRNSGADDAEYEIFLRLVRTETGEVLAVTKARAAEGLGL